MISRKPTHLGSIHRGQHRVADSNFRNSVDTKLELANIRKWESWPSREARGFLSDPADNTIIKN